MDIISRSAAGLPSPSALSRKTTPWAGITWHHTGGNPTTWKAIHDWQTSGRPAGDRLVYIGYSYGIGLDGRVTELRGWDYRAAGDHENSRLQVCLMGNWASKLPPQAALNAALEFARYAQQRAGKAMPGVAHRDVWSGGPYDTDCPGNALYAWVRANLTTIRAGEEGDEEMDPQAKYIQHVINWRLEGILANRPVINVPKYETRDATGKLFTFPAITDTNQLAVALGAQPPVTVDVDEAALAAALAPLLETGATAEEVAAAVRAELDKTRLVGG